MQMAGGSTYMLMAHPGCARAGDVAVGAVMSSLGEELGQFGGGREWSQQDLCKNEP